VTDEQVMFDFLAQHFLLASDDQSLIKSKVVLIKSAPHDVDLLERTIHAKITYPETNAEKQ
jgi:hypothetical protein